MQAGQIGYAFVFIPQDQYGNLVDFSTALSITLDVAFPGGVIGGSYPCELSTQAYTTPSGETVAIGAAIVFTTSSANQFPLGGTYVATLTGYYADSVTKPSAPFNICVEDPVTDPGMLATAGSLYVGIDELAQMLDIDMTTLHSGYVLSATPSNGKPFSWVAP